MLQHMRQAHKKNDRSIFILLTLIFLLIFHVLLFLILYFAPDYNYKPTWMLDRNKEDSATSTIIELQEPQKKSPIPPITQTSTQQQEPEPQNPIIPPPTNLFKQIPLPEPSLPATIKPGSGAFDPNFDPHTEDIILGVNPDQTLPTKTEITSADQEPIDMTMPMQSKEQHPKLARDTTEDTPAPKQSLPKTDQDAPATTLEVQEQTPEHTSALQEEQSASLLTVRELSANALKQFALRNLLKDPSKIPTDNNTNDTTQASTTSDTKIFNHDTSDLNSHDTVKQPDLKNFSVAKSFVQNCAQGQHGFGLLERKGDDNKKLSWDEIPLISYLNKLAWCINKGIAMYQRNLTEHDMIQLFEHQVTCVFSIMHDGNITNLTAYSINQDYKREHLAKGIIRMAAPFPLLSRQLKRDYLEVLIRFAQENTGYIIKFGILN